MYLVNTLIFGFEGTNTEKVAQLLSDVADIKIIKSSETGIENFISRTDFSHYKHIIGIGMYSGRDKDRVRIETECSSQFRNKKENLIRLSIPYFIDENDIFKLAKGIGNSWCNLVSFRLIKTQKVANYTFLHVPRTMSVTKVANAVRTVLSC